MWKGQFNSLGSYYLCWSVESGKEEKEGRKVEYASLPEFNHRHGGKVAGYGRLQRISDEWWVADVGFQALNESDESCRFCLPTFHYALHHYATDSCFDFYVSEWGKHYLYRLTDSLTHWLTDYFVRAAADLAFFFCSFWENEEVIRCLSGRSNLSYFPQDKGKKKNLAQQSVFIKQASRDVMYHINVSFNATVPESYILLTYLFTVAFRS